MFVVPLFTVAKTWKQLKGLMDDWISNMWFIHTMEYYSAFKRKEILTYATMLMNLEDTILSKISQLQKDQYCMNGGC